MLLTHAHVLLTHAHVMLQVSDMTNAELLQYKRYLQKYVFAGWEAPDDLKEWVRLLERHILHADMQAEGEEKAMTDGDEHVDHPATNGTDGCLDEIANCMLPIHAYMMHCSQGVMICRVVQICIT